MVGTRLTEIIFKCMHFKCMHVPQIDREGLGEFTANPHRDVVFGQGRKAD